MDRRLRFPERKVRNRASVLCDVPYEGRPELVFDPKASLKYVQQMATYGAMLRFGIAANRCSVSGKASDDK